MTKRIELICTVDTNDGDYETEINTITEQQIADYTPVWKRIAEIGYTWSYDIDAVRKKLEAEFGEELIEKVADYLLIPEYGESRLIELKIVVTQTVHSFK